MRACDIDGDEALGVTDDNGSAFWVIPRRQLAILNIANRRWQQPARAAGDVVEGNRGAAGRPLSVRKYRVAARGGRPHNAAMDMKVSSMTDGFLDSREFARMTRAIEFIEREYQRQPKLAEIAQGRRPVRISFQPAVPPLDRTHSQAVSRRSHEPRGAGRRCTPSLQCSTPRTL